MPAKTRIAPTPSGYLHQGNLFSFALTWVMAKRENLKILLRIDDMDRARFRPEFLEDIFRSLEALGIDYDEGPQGPDDFIRAWSQVHRQELYWQALSQMKEKNQLFACNCSRKEIASQSPAGYYLGNCKHRALDFAAEKTAWRWNKENSSVTICDWQGICESKELSPDMAYVVLKTKENYPAYQLCSLVDDVHFGISNIVRGQDLEPSSICQIALAADVGLEDFRQMRFLHHPLMKQGEEKLSKSKDAPAAHIYRDFAAKQEVFDLVAQYLHLPKGFKSLREILLAIT